MSEFAKIKGLADLQAAMGQLPVKVETNIMRAALRAGCKPILEAAKKNVPVQTGDLRDSLRITSGSTKRGRVMRSVVAGGKVKGKPGRVWYAHIVEGGAAAHVIQARNGRMLAIGVSKVNHPGFAGKPFMRPAFDGQAQAAVVAVREYIRERLALKHGLNVPAPDEGAGSDE